MTETEPSPPAKKAFSYEDDEIATAVDEALKDDMDEDGYVEYYEFSLSQKMARSADPRLARGVGNGVDGEKDPAGNARPPSWKVDVDDGFVNNLNNVVARGTRPSAANEDSSVKPPGWTPDADDNDDNNDYDEDGLRDVLENGRRRHQPHDGQTQARQEGLKSQPHGGQ